MGRKHGNQGVFRMLGVQQMVRKELAETAEMTDQPSEVKEICSNSPTSMTSTQTIP